MLPPIRLTKPAADCRHPVAAGHALAWRTRPGYRGEGWPTSVLKEGRQVLFGNVGDRVLEANIRELLREPAARAASWC